MTLVSVLFHGLPPLCRGHLARKPDEFGSTARSKGEKANSEIPETDLKIIKRVIETAEKKDWPMAHVALAWINAKVASPIIGFSNTDRIDQAVTAKGKVLTEEEIKYLEELYEPKKISGHT